MGSKQHRSSIRGESTAANPTPNLSFTDRIWRLMRRPSFFRLRRPTALTGVWVLALTTVLPISAVQVLAEDRGDFPILHLTGSNQSLDADLTLSCPHDGSIEPQFRNQRTGQVIPITDPRLRAVAQKACGQDLLGAAETGTVKLVNDRAGPIFVGYSGGGTVHWEANASCTPVTTGAGGLKILGGHSCAATVSSTNSGSRFCASPNAPPNCTQAQNNHQTLIEPTFDTSDQCSWTHEPGTCVSYDISVIPVGCTDELWNRNKCAGAEGASYNFPVEMSCSGKPPAPTFTCQGPADGTYDPQKYPKKCGNPDAACIGNSQACVNAYFFPMFSGKHSAYQPVGVCSGGRTLTITFLAGS
jgi:hypothetical protein